MKQRRARKLEELDRRKDAILKSLEDNGHLTDNLRSQVQNAPTLTVLEDLYLPYRPKRRTRATQARERGLEPLAKAIFAQDDMDPELEANRYLNAEKDVSTVEEALSGARDIIAEWVSEDAKARERIRSLYESRGVLSSRVISDKAEEGAKYRSYFEWDEPISKAPSHRVLAMRRAEKEGFLTLRISPPKEETIQILKRQFVKRRTPSSLQVEMAIEDGFSRLLSTSIETEIRQMAKIRAEQEAISIFSENLRQLLMAAPLGKKKVMAFDPGFRTGCKMVCLDIQGKLLHTDTVYPGQNASRDSQAAIAIENSCKKFDIEAIAIGNGTGGRELESFIRALDLPKNPPIIMVNESGASVYSASEAAREEFPDHDLTIRGSVSIGRRLLDPLSELVKIDPKSIGVGQYQHDVDQKALKSELEDVVISCV
ncbi:MAG: Tex-like N-terminal domain-containing protein, partial [Nitrospinaceae bacterium]|nr:Tex-like N-terminal domain-containing protein [Nitrospinaceae bacterium]